MKYEDFLELGFKVHREDQYKSPIKILKTDDHYTECLEYAKANKEMFKIVKFIWQFNYGLSSIEYDYTNGGAEITDIIMLKWVDVNKYILKKDNIQLIIECDINTNEIYEIKDQFQYHGSKDFVKVIFERNKLRTADDISIAEFIDEFKQLRLEDIQKVEDHYNKKIDGIRAACNKQLEERTKSYDILKEMS